ncbi:hypothetical protein LG293_16320 (plasmid) [Citricoccus nitrophenolicus]
MSDSTTDPLAALDAADKATPKPAATTKSKKTSGSTGAPPKSAAAAPKAPSSSAPVPGSDEARSPAKATEMDAFDALVRQNLPEWTAADYAPVVTGSGAAKLASSAVAPLVAAARGYYKVDESNFKEVMKLAELPANKKQYKILAQEMVGDGGDGLVMPWYSIAGVQNAIRTGVEPEPTCIQMRPHKPVSSSKRGDIDKKTGLQRTMKYALPGGSITPMELHPAVPSSWIDTTPIVMFTEGLLKGDAALSGWLRHMGATDEELADISEGARERLTALMERVVAEREGDTSADFRPLVIITLVGVSNIRQNPADWREIQLKGREGWVAFDADVAKNPHVWTAAYRLWKILEDKNKMSSLKILNPVATTGEDAALEKMGVDDFLAERGEWPQLTAYLQNDLPPAPLEDESKNGAWRVAPDGRSTEECVIEQDGMGIRTGVYWTTTVPLGGRILSSEVRRRPTVAELATGEFERGVSREDYEEVRARVEVSWERHGEQFEVVIDGPERFLNYSPEQWDRHGADIPTDLLYHPSWPPTGKDGTNWMSAVKANRDDEISKSTRWTQMGWVPVDGLNTPVFLVGDQVVGDPDMDKSLVVPGVNEEVLEAAGHYGLSQEAIALDWSDDRHRAAIREDLGALITAYVKNRPWVDPGVAAVALCAGLRPCIPVRPRATIFLVGGKGSGKSWTAERAMSFWERFDHADKSRAHWLDGTLPGSAKDTIAFVENAVSKTPIWVVDDLAPSSSARQSESENAKLEDLTRNIFNNASKGRMNADMTTRRSNAPMAQLIITAENDLQVPSVRERLVPVRFQSGAALGTRESTDEAVSLHESGIPAKVTVHLLKFIRQLAADHPKGWPGWIDQLRDDMVSLQAMIIDSIESEHGSDDESQKSRQGALKRAGMLAADLAIMLHLLVQLADYAGLDPELTALLREDTLQQDLVNLVRSAHTENADSSPGRAVTESLKDLLSSGRAHITAPEAPGAPPVRTGDAEYDLRANTLLGWAPRGPEGELQPLGVKVGELCRRAKTKEDVVAFSDQFAFSEAARAFPNRIPAGSRSYQVWCGVWDEGLAPRGLTRGKDGSKPKVVHQFLFSATDGGKRISVRGVPVRLSVILGEEIHSDGAEDASSTSGADEQAPEAQESSESTEA